MACAAEQHMQDAKKVCGNGYCNGADPAGCECFNNDEGGYWKCTKADVEVVPPLPTTDGPGRTPPAALPVNLLPLQFPTRILDFSQHPATTFHNGAPQCRLGEPDATDRYFKAHESNLQNSWEPVQYYCDQDPNPQLDFCKNQKCCPYYDGQNKANYTDKYQYVVLEYAEAVYLSDVWVYENQFPGSVVGIYAQPAPQGAAAAPGGGAPITEIAPNGTKVSKPVAKADKPLDLSRVEAANLTALNDVASGVDPASASGINTNPDPFVPVWTKSDATGETLPQTPRHSDAVTFGVDTFFMEFKTKVIKVVFYPFNNGRVQVDTIGILGFQVSGLNLTGQCPGTKEINASAPGAAPENVNEDKRVVTCSGNGVCGVTGCQCKGHFEGMACDRCQFGWTGDDCMTPVPIPDIPGLKLCRVAMFEDLNDFDQTELLLRWDVLEYTPLTSRVFSSRHFGIKFVSPLITLGKHTHVRVQTGFFVNDLPNHQDSGIIVRAAKARSLFPGRDRTAQERIDDGERIVFVKNIQYQTGVNVIGVGKGDTSETMDITTMWEAPEISLEYEVWSPDILEKVGKGDHRLTLTYFTVQACNYPSLRGTANPDSGSLN
eukprot:gene4943-2246_t